MLDSCNTCPAMTSYTNGGQLTYTAKGKITLLAQIDDYFNGCSVANIVALHDVTLNYHVTMDSDKSNSIYVHTNDGIYEFKCCSDGLYFVDTAVLDSHKTNDYITA